jgi:hypothetical protein
MTKRGRAFATLAALWIAAVGVVLPSTSPADGQTGELRPSGGGEVRALVIGIDRYQAEPPLRGAVADARDIATTLRESGAKDVTVLYDAEADRARVMRALDELVGRSTASDLVIVALAGYGAREPERVAGSRPGGRESVFLLAGFDPRTVAGTEQRILDSELLHVARQFDARGSHVLFVTDASYGTAQAREIDARTGERSYRHAQDYRIDDDRLHPVSTADDAKLRASDLPHLLFLSATDDAMKAPEIRVPGVAGYRGALSYAVARGLAGAADENKDGDVTEGELIRYVNAVTYQLSDERQDIAASTRLGGDKILGRTRAVVLLDAIEKPDAARPQKALPTAPDAAAGQMPRPSVTAPSQTVSPLAPVKIAVAGDHRELLANIEAGQAPFTVVAAGENPDLVWDPTSHEVLSGGDVISRDVDRPGIAGVIDRAAAVNGFKALAAKGPQAIRVLPNDKVHHRDERLEVQVSALSNRALLLFNITGDGLVQMLYPIGSDPRVIASPDYKFTVRVGEPLGADQVVAITSSQRLVDLEEALKKLNQRRAPVEVYRLAERYAPADARIGAAGLFTAP